MSDKQNPAAPKQPEEPKAEARPASASAPAAGDLDLEIEEIQRPELMKEGFVGQER